MNELSKAIRAIAQTDDETYSVIGIVTEIDEAARVVSVAPINGDAELLDIRLQAAQKQTVGAVFFPKKGSAVVVTFLAKNNGYVALFSEVEKCLWTVDKQEFEFTKNGVKLTNGQASLADEMGKLLDTMDALIQTLLQFQLATNVGPTISVMPQVVSLLTQHKTDFLAIKTQLKTILN